jgi:hypothetical protein
MNATLSRVLAVEEHGRELYEAAQRLDLEGIVAKRKQTPTRRRPSGTRSRIPHTPKQRDEGTSSISLAEYDGNCLDSQRTGEPLDPP